MDSNKEEETFDMTNPLYQLLEKQAKQFELFGQRLKSGVQNTCQEFAELQSQKQQESTQNGQDIDHEKFSDYQKSRLLLTNITKLGDSQSESLESLNARVKELETDFVLRNQDIKKLRQDFKIFHELLIKSQTNKSDNKGKSINNSKGVMWEGLSYTGFNWDDDVEHESIRAKAAASRASNSNNLSSSPKKNTLKINQIHAKVQEAIIRRNNLGKPVKRRNLKFLSRDFSIYDLCQYTKSGKFNSLNKRVKKIINNLIEESQSTSSNTLSSHPPSKPQENQEIQEIPTLENLHSQIQHIVEQKELLGHRVRLKHFKDLEKCFFTNDFIEYTNTNLFNSLDNNSKRLVNLLIYEILSDEFKNSNVKLSQNLDEYIKRGVIPELPSGCNNYTTYRESEMFNKLNKMLKERVNKLIKLESKILY